MLLNSGPCSNITLASMFPDSSHPNPGRVKLQEPTIAKSEGPRTIRTFAWRTRGPGFSRISNRSPNWSRTLRYSSQVKGGGAFALSIMRRMRAFGAALARFDSAFDVRFHVVTSTSRAVSRFGWICGQSLSLRNRIDLLLPRNLESQRSYRALQLSYPSRSSQLLGQ